MPSERKNNDFEIVGMQVQQNILPKVQKFIFIWSKH